jgi:hypothetical protein
VCVCEAHSFGKEISSREVLGLRGSQVGVHHFMIRDSEIESQSKTKLGK